MTAPAPATTLSALRRRYDGFLLDAYGVLVDKERALPGAAALLAGLARDGVPWLVVTNSASRLPETLSAEFAALGLAVPAERILTSGALLADPSAVPGLRGCRALVLGPEEACAYAARAGARVVELSAGADAEAVIVADQKGVRWPEHLDWTASLMLRRLDAGQALQLILCNPDLIYPVGPGRVGFTAGGLAAMLEALLRERWPRHAPGFLRLGKPARPIFDTARRRLGARHPVMLGDQLATDIAGAASAGIDSVLLASGLAPRADTGDWPLQPTWLLDSLEA